MVVCGLEEVWASSLSVDEVWLLADVSINKDSAKITLKSFTTKGWDFEDHWKSVKLCELRRADGSKVPSPYPKAGDNTEMKVITPFLLFLLRCRSKLVDRSFVKSELFTSCKNFLNTRSFSQPVDVDRLQKTINENQQQILDLQATLDRYNDVKCPVTKRPRILSSIEDLSKHPSTHISFQRRASHAVARAETELQEIDLLLAKYHDTLQDTLYFAHKFNIQQESVVASVTEQILKDKPSIPTTLPAVDDVVDRALKGLKESLYKPEWIVCIHQHLCHFAYSPTISE